MKEFRLSVLGRLNRVGVHSRFVFFHMISLYAILGFVTFGVFSGSIIIISWNLAPKSRVFFNTTTDQSFTLKINDEVLGTASNRTSASE